jgi:hypothetical protein
MFIGLRSYGVDVSNLIEILLVEYIKWDGISLADDLWSQCDLKNETVFWEIDVIGVDELNTKHWND